MSRMRSSTATERAVSRWSNTERGISGRRTSWSNSISALSTRMECFWSLQDPKRSRSTTWPWSCAMEWSRWRSGDEGRRRNNCQCDSTTDNGTDWHWPRCRGRPCCGWRVDHRMQRRRSIQFSWNYQRKLAPQMSSLSEESARETTNYPRNWWVVQRGGGCANFNFISPLRFPNWKDSRAALGNSM